MSDQALDLVYDFMTSEMRELTANQKTGKGQRSGGEVQLQAAEVGARGKAGVKGKGGAGAGTKGKGKSKDGKGKGKDERQECWYFQTDAGCAKGGSCTKVHVRLGKGDSRCFNCGSKPPPARLSPTETRDQGDPTAQGSGSHSLSGLLPRRHL